MAIQKTEGIVLRRQDLRETSVIITFYTRGFGKIKGILRGVRGARIQSYGGNFEIFSRDEIVFYENKNRDVYTISQCDLTDFFSPIRGSLEKLSYAAYVIELLDSVTTLGDKNEEVFSLLVNTLKLLEGDASPRRVARIFEIKLLHLLGLMPTLESCASCGSRIGPGAKFSLRHGGLICKACLGEDGSAYPIMAGTARFIEHIRSMPFDKVARFKVSAEVGKELEGTLRKFLDYHIERRLKTLEFVRKIA